MSARALTAVCAALLVGACAVGPVGYDGDVGVDYYGGFYEPYGYDYGGWGPGYYVGPPRGGDRRRDGGRDGDHGDHGDHGPGGDHGGGPGHGGPGFGGDHGGGGGHGSGGHGGGAPSIPGGARGGGGGGGHHH
jgi:hypothetical protein